MDFCELIKKYAESLAYEEKSGNTTEKYIRDVSFFARWLGDGELTKAALIDYKAYLCGKYAPASANSVISSLNSFFAFCGRHDLRIKTLKIQRRIFSDKERELTGDEYMRLLTAAKSRNNRRLYYVLQTLCSCGLRVSELRFITAESVMSGEAAINCKGKMRTVFLPRKLCEMLRKYMKKNGIRSGSVFVTRGGKPLDRSYIWKMMKSLCADAHVAAAKVFPHNLRHLFARTYYSVQKDVVRLADILGHSSINTTRLYTVESGDVHRSQIQTLGLLMC